MRHTAPGGPGRPARRLTRAHRARGNRLRAAFSRADLDSDGFISLDELKRSLRTARPGLSNAAVTRMLRAADLDGDNKVGFEEYVQIMTTELPSSGVA